MKISQIRNTSLIIEYAGKPFLPDPWFGPEDDFHGFEGTPNSHIRNPTVELPVPVSELTDVYAMTFTHIHPDHWDAAAADALPTDDAPVTRATLARDGVVDVAGFMAIPQRRVGG